MYEPDSVAGGILSDHDGMMRAEGVEDESFVGIRSPVLSQHLPVMTGGQRSYMCFDGVGGCCVNSLRSPAGSIATDAVELSGESQIVGTRAYTLTPSASAGWMNGLGLRTSSANSSSV